jgi:FkbM family methyltransferase
VQKRAIFETIFDAEKDFMLVVGASTGEWPDPNQWFIEKYAPNSLLLEPLPEAFKKLQERYPATDARYARIKLASVALADSTGSIEFFIGDHKNGTNSSLKRGLPEMSGKNITVESKTYKDLLESFALPEPCILYTDMEGCDHLAITQVLDFGHRPKLIDFVSNRLTPEDIGDGLIDTLQEAGYKIFHLGGIQSNILYPYAGGDLMAIREDVLNSLADHLVMPLSPLVVEEIAALRKRGKILDPFGWRCYARFAVMRLKHFFSGSNA